VLAPDPHQRLAGNQAPGDLDRRYSSSPAETRASASRSWVA
jgi:hypothetical protein